MSLLAAFGRHTADCGDKCPQEIYISSKDGDGKFLLIDKVQHDSGVNDEKQNTRLSPKSPNILQIQI